MPAPPRTPILVGLALTLLLAPASASAQKSGFFFRGSLGPGYSRFHSDVGLDIQGPSGLLSLSFGKFVSGDLVFFGDIFGSSIRSPTLKVDDVEVDSPGDVTWTLSGIGGGVGIYSDTNIFLGVAAGISFLHRDWPEYGLQGRTKAGAGLSLLIGKDWQVGDTWNLGVAGHFIGSTIEDGNITWTPRAFGIDFTFTYASGGIG